MTACKTSTLLPGPVVFDRRMAMSRFLSLRTTSSGIMRIMSSNPHLDEFDPRVDPLKDQGVLTRDSELQRHYQQQGERRSLLPRSPPPPGELHLRVLDGDPDQRVGRNSVALRDRADLLDECQCPQERTRHRPRAWLTCPVLEIVEDLNRAILALREVGCPGPSSTP